MQGNDRASGDVYMPMPLGPAMKDDLPEVKEYVRFREGWGDNCVRSGDEVVRLPVSFADPAFFKVFTFPLVAGNRSNPLQELNSIVVTEKIAKRLFGNESAIGKTLRIKLEESFEPFIITAVAKEIPPNSSVTFDLIGNFNFLATTQSGKRSVANWNRSSYLTFVELREGTDDSRLKASLS